MVNRITTIHYPVPTAPLGEPGEKVRRKDMSITFKKKQESTGGIRGRVATEPMVRVSENGQLGFNSLCLAIMKDCKYAIWGYDGENAKRKATTCQVRVLAAPAKGFPVKIGGEVWQEKDFAKIGWSKDGKSAFCGLSPEFKEVGYDYKASGTQSFKATIDEKGKTITFELPVGALTPKPKVARAKKDKTAAKAANGVDTTAAKNAAADLENELGL